MRLTRHVVVSEGSTWNCRMGMRLTRHVVVSEGNHMELQNADVTYQACRCQ